MDAVLFAPSVYQGSQASAGKTRQGLTGRDQEGGRRQFSSSRKRRRAARRNRMRRRRREIYRLNEGRFRRGYDIVVVARSRAMDAPYAELEKAYLALAEKLSLLQDEAQE